MNRPWPGLGWSLAVLLVCLAAQAAVAWLLIKFAGMTDLTLLAGTTNLCSLVPVAVLAFWRSGEAPNFGPSRVGGGGFWTALVLSAVGGTVVLGELANLTAWIVPVPPQLAQMFNQLTEGSPVVSLFTLALVAPLTEEALFRGLLLRSFARRYGPGVGMLLSSALFAAFHLNVWQALAAFVAGLYLGRLYLAAGSLWPSMVAHALFNGLPVMLAAAGLSVRGYNAPTSPGVTEFQPWPWLLAGVILLAAGLWLTRKWAPLPPPQVSDTVEK